VDDVNVGWAGGGGPKRNGAGAGVGGVAFSDSRLGGCEGVGGAAATTEAAEGPGTTAPVTDPPTAAASSTA
jgi:hypothetical protein